MILRPIDLGTLNDLRLAVDASRRLGADIWLRPMDIGGRDGSSHSYRLKKLTDLGFVEARQRGSVFAWQRGSKLYTITEAGREKLKQEGF